MFNTQPLNCIFPLNAFFVHMLLVIERPNKIARTNRQFTRVEWFADVVVAPISRPRILSTSLSRPVKTSVLHLLAHATREPEEGRFYLVS